MGKILSPKGHLAKSGDYFGCHNWLLPPSGYRTEILQNISPCTGQAPTTNHSAQHGNSAKLRNPVSQGHNFTS